MSKSLSAIGAIALIIAGAPQMSLAQVSKPNTAFAATVTQNPFFTAQEQLDFNAITARYDQKIIAAFQNNATEKTIMETELKAIDAETDPVKREAMIKTYQSKHMASYKKTLAEGHVDLNTMTLELNAKIPNIEFRLTDGIHISAKSRNLELVNLNIEASQPTKGGAKVTIASTNNNASATLQARTVKNLLGSDYSTPKDLGCGAIAGSDISFDGGYMTNKTFAAFAGGCRNEGAFEHDFLIRDGQKAKVDMSFGLEAKVFAIGILGVAGSFAAATAVIRDDNNHVVKDDFNREYSYFCAVIAPVLWSDTHTCGTETGIISATITESRAYKIKVRTETYATAFPFGTYATAESRVKKLRTTITTEPK